jgi:hypothetical protein
LYKSLLEKTRDGMWIVKSSSGKHLGTFKDRELAMQRLWQVDDQMKHAREVNDRRRFIEERKRAEIRR